MKMSTKGQYALEIAADLALHSDEKNLESLKHIAQRRKLSEKYLERIVKSLKKAGIVKSVRGAHGGYCLAADPSSITVLDILQAAEGEMAPVACLTEKQSCAADCRVCPTKQTWETMWQYIQNTVQQVTLREIIEYAENERI